MKIHRLRLCHVKGVLDRTLEFPDSGVVVIEGPNEVGKSTFLEALDRLLDPKAKASSKAAAITTMQPVGLDVGPRVEAELSVGDYRLVFAKQWLRAPATTLHVLSPTPEQLTGEAAQARMTAILDECLDRPLFEALRFAQSGSSEHLRLGDSTVLAAALDGAAGAALHVEGGSALLEAVEEEYRRYFTPTSARPTGDLRAGLSAVNEARDAAVQAHQELVEAESLIEQRNALAARVEHAGDELPVQEHAVREATEAVELTAALRERRRRAEEVHQEAGAAAERARSDLDTRTGLIDEVATREAALTDDFAVVVDARQHAEQARATVEAGQETLRLARDASATAQDQADQAVQDLSHLREVDAVSTLMHRVHDADALMAELDTAQAQLAGAPVSAASRGEITETHRGLEVLEAAVEAGSTTLTVEALVGGHVVSFDGAATELSAGGESVERHVTDGTDLVVNEAVRVQIRPHADVSERATRRDALRIELRRQLDAVGAADVAHAHSMATEHEKAQAALVEVQRRLAATLAGQDLDDLRTQGMARQVAIQQYLADRDGPALPADPEHGARALAQAQQRLPALRQERAAAEDSVDDLRTAETVAQRAHDVALARHEGDAAELRRLQSTLSHARAQVTDDELVDGVQDRLARLREAVVTLEEAHTEADLANADEVETRLAEVSEHRDQVRRRLEGARAEFHEVKGRLEMTAAEGRQEAYDRALQTLSEAHRGFASVERRARAARQLHRTLQRHRDVAHASYVAPYAAQIERLGAAVYGDSFGVNVSGDLVITHRHLDGVTVPFDQLSGGAQEQLGIIARVAVSLLIESEQSVPVVIDDALGYTDPDRLRRVGAVLGGGAHHGQIILLTCTPSRYAVIPGGHTISLSA